MLGTFLLALGSINEKVYLIRRFGCDRSPHQWYLLKSRKYKKDAVANFTYFLGITRVLNIWYKKEYLMYELKMERLDIFFGTKLNVNSLV